MLNNYENVVTKTTRKLNTISCDDFRLRIFLSYSYNENHKKVAEVVVVKHDRQYDAPQVIVDCIGDELGRVYETEGEIIERSDYGKGWYRETKATMTEQYLDYMNSGVRV